MSALSIPGVRADRLSDRYAAFIFDLDGVLLLSGEAHEWAYREALRGAGAERFDYARYAGMRTADALRLALLDNGLELADAELRRLAKRKTDLAASRLDRENPLAPGCLATLERLHGRTRLALASSGSRRNVRSFVKRNRLERLFEFVIDGEEVRAAKPAPEIYLRAIARLDLAAARCLAIEDSLAGVEAARAAGADVCGLPTAVSAEALRAAGCAFVLEGLPELLA